MFLLFSFLLGSLCLTTQVYSSTPDAEDTQQITHVKKNSSQSASSINNFLAADQEADLVTFFLRPITFTSAGLKSYFEHVYNHPKYADYLQYNLAHMIQFLEYGLEHQQDTGFALSVIKLFTQKIKACPFVDGTNFTVFVPHLANTLQPYLDKKEAGFLEDIGSKLKLHMTNVFSKYFSYFKSNPDAFMDALSKQIAQQTNQLQTEQHVDIAYLQKDLLRFFELCINKLILPADDISACWKDINATADAFHAILKNNVLTGLTAFDDLSWSLVHRFCYILQLSYKTISQDTYNKIMGDIRNQSYKLLETAEQEEFIQTKRGYLLQQLDYYKHLAYPKTKQQDSLKEIMRLLA